MRRIKIKVKYIILILFIVLATNFVALPKTILLRAKALETVDGEKSRALYKKYLSLVPYSKQKPEILFNMAKSIYPENDIVSRVKICNMWSSHEVVVDETMAEQAEKYYLDILNHHGDSEFANKAYENLIQIYFGTGKFLEAEELIEIELKENKWGAKEAAYAYKMFYELIEGDYKETIALGENYLKSGKETQDIYILLGEASLYLGKNKEAKEYYDRAHKIGFSYNKYGDLDPDSYGRDSVMISKYRMDPMTRSGYIDYLSTIKGQSSISGKVMKNGKPLPFTFVFLIEGSDTSFTDNNRELAFITDQDGNYRIEGIKPGYYDIGISIPSNQLFDTVMKGTDKINLDENQNIKHNIEFVEPIKLHGIDGKKEIEGDTFEVSWDEVKGANHYIVMYTVYHTKDGKMVGSTSMGLSDRITDTSFKVNIKEMGKQMRGYSFGGDGIINPEAYLGAFYPGAEVPVYVEAYDENEKRITSTQAYFSKPKDLKIVTIPSEGTNEGYTLIKEYKYAEAKKFFESELKKNPNNEEYLEILYKLYTLGEVINLEGEDDEGVIGRDIDRAYEISQKLYDITKDYFYLKRPLEYGKGFSSEKIIELYKRIPKEELDLEDYFALADANLYVKEYKEADKYYDLVQEVKGKNKIYTIDPILLKLYFDEYDKAFNMINSDDFSFYNSDYIKIKKWIGTLNQEKPRIEEKEKLNKVLEILFSNEKRKIKEEKIKVIYKNIKDNRIKELLKEVFKDSYIEIIME